jgi:hypothetical protein
LFVDEGESHMGDGLTAASARHEGIKKILPDEREDSIYPTFNTRDMGIVHNSYGTQVPFP